MYGTHSIALLPPGMGPATPLMEAVRQRTGLPVGLGMGGSGSLESVAQIPHGMGVGMRWEWVPSRGRSPRGVGGVVGRVSALSLPASRGRRVSRATGPMARLGSGVRIRARADSR